MLITYYGPQNESISHVHNIRMLAFTPTTRYYEDGVGTCGITTSGVTIIALLHYLSYAMQCRQLALILAFWVSTSISWIAQPLRLVRPPSLGIRGCGVKTCSKSGIIPLFSSKTGITATDWPSDSLVNPTALISLYCCIITGPLYEGFIIPIHIIPLMNETMTL